MECKGCEKRFTQACRYCAKNSVPRAMLPEHLEYYENAYKVAPNEYIPSKAVRAVMSALDEDTLEPIICEMYFRRMMQRDIAEMLGLPRYVVCRRIQIIQGKLSFMARFKSLCKDDAELMAAFMEQETEEE